MTGYTDKSVGWLTNSDAHEVGAGDMLQWTADSNGLYFVVSEQGDTLVYRANVTNGTLLQRTAPLHEIGSFSATGGEKRLVVTMASATVPHELYCLTDEAEQISFWKPLHAFNADFLADVRVANPQPIGRINGSNEIGVDNGSGGKVFGWLLKPAYDYRQAGAKYPLVVYVHGGPHLQYGNTFHHELQWLAAQGYVVLYTNPRGSKGYGEAHTKAIAGNWGSVDYDDIMAATDWACSLDFVDAGRTAIMGGSYGGYMTAWAIGHTNRFHCAIADRLVANLQSMSGTCDFPWRPDHPFKGNGWSDPAQLWKCSPLAYAGNIVTPLLLIHYDGDLRCPAEQAEQLFSALRHQRKVVEYVRYPGEASHGLSRSGPPDLRLDRLQRNLDWLNRWLKA